MSTRGTAVALVSWLVCGLVACGKGDRYDFNSLRKKKESFLKSAGGKEKAAEAGRKVYRRRCAGCHGDDGKGNGGSAPYLDPRPRNFVKDKEGTSPHPYKFRWTKSGELPTAEGMFRVISRGVPGTAMPAWGEGDTTLSETQRWQVTFYLQTFNEDFANEDFDPYGKDRMLPYPKPPKQTKARIDRGREIFVDEKKGGCLKCHGENGRGNGKEAGTQKDSWGDPILPADLTKGWRYKNGSSVREIFRSISTGLYGTPMPGYETLSEDDRWDVAFFVHSLIYRPDTSGKQLLRAEKRKQIPADPFSKEWTRVKALDVQLMGQLFFRPRHHNVAVDLVQVRALYNDQDIAFHFSWNDRTKSDKHVGSKGGEPPFKPPTDSSPRSEELKKCPEIPGLSDINDSFIPAARIWKRRSGCLRDSLQIQFPTKLSAGAKKPYFFLGGKGGPVYLWRWFADHEASGKGRAFDERNRNGAGNKPTSQDSADQSLTGKAVYKDGRWALIIQRPRKTNGKNDIQFEDGALVPFAVHIWDGGNGEEGLIRSASAWFYVRLDRPTPASAYIAGVGTFLGALLLLLLFVHLARRSQRSSSDPVATTTATGESPG